MADTERQPVPISLFTLFPATFRPVMTRSGAVEDVALNKQRAPRRAVQLRPIRPLENEGVISGGVGHLAPPSRSCPTTRRHSNAGWPACCRDQYRTW